MHDKFEISVKEDSGVYGGKIQVRPFGFTFFPYTSLNTYSHNEGML